MLRCTNNKLASTNRRRGRGLRIFCAAVAIYAGVGSGAVHAAWPVSFISSPYFGYHPPGWLKRCAVMNWGSYGSIYVTQNVSHFWPSGTCGSGSTSNRPAGYLRARAYSWNGSTSTGYQETSNPAGTKQYLAQAQVSHGSGQTAWCSWAFYWKWVEGEWTDSDYWCRS